MQSMIPALAVADIEASVRFYTDVLGFASRGILTGEDGKPVHASLARGQASIMFGALDQAGFAPDTRLGLGVGLYSTVGDDEDIDALFAHAKRAGATVLQEPTDQFWGMRDWSIADPDGYVVFVSKQTRAMSIDQMRDEMLVGAGAD